MFFERLKILRENKGFTQEHMAKALKISRPTYTRYETGKREPDYVMLAQIAAFFDVSVDYLLGLTDEPSFESKSAPKDKFALEIAKLSPEKRKQAENFVEFLKIQEEFSEELSAAQLTGGTKPERP